jgi:hypothetical protein
MSSNHIKVKRKAKSVASEGLLSSINLAYVVKVLWKVLRNGSENSV